jgi:hypothetical protein
MINGLFNQLWLLFALVPMKLLAPRCSSATYRDIVFAS